MTTHQGKPGTITLLPSVQHMLGKHMLTCHPQEACGIVLGAAAAGGMRIDNYMPMRNVAPNPLHSFIPDPQQWVRAMFLSPPPVGLFHSHPSAAPWPSEADMMGLPALGTDFRVYLIGSPGESPAVHAFWIDRSGVQPRLIPAGLHGLLK